MNFETVKIGDDIHVSINNVVSAAFVRQGSKHNAWVIMTPRIAQMAETLEEALALIAAGMDTWYTVTEAAIRLVELGKKAKPPARQTMCRWLGQGRFPGAIKVQTAGRGGSWRIPEAAL